MTRAQAERALQNGTLDPKTVWSDKDSENFPNRHVRLRAFKMLKSEEPGMENLKRISESAFKEAEERVSENPENTAHPRWIQKVLQPSV